MPAYYVYDRKDWLFGVYMVRAVADRMVADYPKLGLVVTTQPPYERAADRIHGRAVPMSCEFCPGAGGGCIVCTSN